MTEGTEGTEGTVAGSASHAEGPGRSEGSPRSQEPARNQEPGRNQEPARNQEPGRTVEQRGLWFDEFVEGTRYLHRPGRTVTETDNVLFSTLTMNPQALHLDAAWSARQPFGQRLVNSMFTLSTMVGASVAQLTQGTIVANLGLTDVSFPHPLYHGDTLYCETVVIGKRLSASRPGQGIVTLEHIGRNQDGVVVGRATRAVLMWREGHMPADGAAA